MRKRLTDHPEILKTAAAGLRREISDDFNYNPKKLKHIKHILHNLSVSLGTLVSALNEFSKVKGPDISPDGMLGGLGYIIPIRDMKQDLNQMVHKLSDINDCLADELTNPKWNSKEDAEVKKLIKEKEEVEEKVDEVGQDEDISPDDIVDGVSPEMKTASTDVLSSKIKETLVRFYRPNNKPAI